MLRKEFRYVMPLSMDEYKKGGIWTTIQDYVDEENQEGIRLIEKKLYNDEKGKGQYFRAIYHYPSCIPSAISSLMSSFFPDKALVIHEESWYDYPRTHSRYFAPDFFQDIFTFHVDTVVLPDMGTSENVHKLPSEVWNNVAVEIMDIADETKATSGYATGYNPCTFKSKKNERGSLSPTWLQDFKVQLSQDNSADNSQSSISPQYICAYKLVSCEFKWWGLQNLVQETLINHDGPTMLAFHRKLYCCMDEWIDLSLDHLKSLTDKKLCS